MSVELVHIEKAELADLLYQVARRAAADALAEQAERDEMLNIAQICERTGMSRHTFAILRDQHRIKCVGGKYSLAQVRKAMAA